jgi:hypothetical protein
MNRMIASCLGALRQGVLARTSQPPTAAASCPAWPGHASRFMPALAMLKTLPPIAVYMAASALLPHAVAVLLCLAAQALLTHARAAQDAAPLLGSGAAGPSAAALLSLLILTLLRWEALAQIEPDWLALSLLFAAGTAQAMGVLILASVPRRRLPPEATPVSAWDTLIALGSAALPAILIGMWIGNITPLLLGLATALASSALVRHRLRARLDDPRLATVVQLIAEVATLLGILATLSLQAEALPLEDETP